MKKYLFAILLPLLLLVTTAAAASPGLFPIESIGESGQARWGYMDETGAQPIGFFYAAAGVFNEYGLAVVQNTQGQTGVINQSGAQVVAYQDAPQSVDFNDKTIGFYYPDKTLFFTHDGAPYGTTFPSGVSFFVEDFLRVRQNDLWGYALRDGSMGIEAQFADAGDFVNGRALVRMAGGAYAVLSQNGSLTPLPDDAVYLSIYAGDLAILRDGGAMRLYSVAQNKYIDDMIYQEISPFHDDGHAMVKQGNKWGIISAKGRLTVEPQYYYLSYMGEGMYAARGENGAVRAIDAKGTYIYGTDTYVGGFETFRFGLSWHGTMDGGLVFFNGTVTRRLENAENPLIVSGDVAAVTSDGVRQYIRLSDGKALYTPVRSYQLDDGVTVQTRAYERYAGMLNDGSEYGWKLTYPQFTGMKDEAVQTKINTAIEKFFLDGPSAEARRQSLTGDYGFAFYGRMLVVHANATLGLGAGSTVWNDSIALDFSTGQTYTVQDGLLTDDYRTTLAAQLPDGDDLNSYSYMRMTSDRLLLVRNLPASETAPARTEITEIPYNSIWDAIQTDGGCYAALTAVAAAPELTAPAAPASPAETTTAVVPAENTTVAQPATVFSDVSADHWAYAYIAQASARGLMQGSDGRFAPEQPVLACEAAASLSRALSLPAGTMPGMDNTQWYAPEVGAAYAAGLLGGLEGQNWAHPLSRADVMQLIANTARRNGDPAPAAQTVLSGFRDTASLPANRREAAAYCVQENLITGANGLLHPYAAVTRAEFAKLLVSVVPET